MLPGRAGEVENIVVSALRKVGEERLHDDDQGTEVWEPSTLRGVCDPNAGKVDYWIEGLVAKSEAVVLAATWKTGKTLLIDSLLLAAVQGRAVWGHFRVSEPLRVLLFQLEMPSREDDRRFRRLALGMGRRPEEIPGYVEAGTLAVYHRVPLHLDDRRGLYMFHKTVERHDPHLIVIDSAGAAFAGIDLSDNSAVRRTFSRAFNPVTSAGKSVILAHHRRKRLQAAREDDDHSAILGAQAWGACASRVYTLERIPDRDGKDTSRDFKCRFAFNGGWTPEDFKETVLRVRDPSEEATLVSVLDERAQLEQGGITAKQRAALALKKLVGVRRGVERKAALAEIRTDLEIGETAAKDGLALAKTKGWLAVRPIAGSKNKQELIPGEES